ncbi:hypothetical protein B0J15DRAFT_75317 [Fusarium solani]|uniref:Secreted protein n=1 Tax=Fusarium solani TaxID=169388 RepID=A0A9P9GY10_FUSSL|nr:uncharacterized protein B0J15DRAFT_75317 [Fusarium solani]KAH7246830.1 hypothetical protein B0J15DRAFT_75317 [Fusarium solani]
MLLLALCTVGSLIRPLSVPTYLPSRQFPLKSCHVLPLIRSSSADPRYGASTLDPHQTSPHRRPQHPELLRVFGGPVPPRGHRAGPSRRPLEFQMPVALAYSRTGETEMGSCLS